MFELSELTLFNGGGDFANIYGQMENVSEFHIGSLKGYPDDSGLEALFALLDQIIKTSQKLTAIEIHDDTNDSESLL